MGVEYWLGVDSRMFLFDENIMDVGDDTTVVVEIIDEEGSMTCLVLLPLLVLVASHTEREGESVFAKELVSCAGSSGPKHQFLSDLVGKRLQLRWFGQLNPCDRRRD